MACILTKSATDTRCALGRAPYDRQRDVYQLAQLGEKASIGYEIISQRNPLGRPGLSSLMS